MPRPLSNDLREQIVRVVDGGMSCNATAKKYDVSINAVVKLIQQWKATGSYLPKPVGGHNRRNPTSETKRPGQAAVRP
jgi:transposase